MNGQNPGMLAKLKEIVRLGLSLSAADFKLRNEGSYLGIFWYLLNPLLLFLIMLFVRGAAFSKVAVEHYPVYLIFGLVMYNFFNRFIKSSTDLVRRNGALLKTIRFDSKTLVVSELFQMTWSHSFEVVLIAAFMLWFGASPLGLLWYPLVFIFFAMFLVGASFLIATLGVYVYDLGNVWDAVSSLVFFVTPTFYALDASSALHAVNLTNPLYYYLSIARDLAIYGTSPGLPMLTIASSMSVASLGIGLAVFNSQRRKFAEFV